MPTVIEETHSPIRGGHSDARPRISRPLEYSGSLDRYQNQDLTPVIGREYEGLQVAEILQSPDRDQLIQDLAATSRLNQALSPVAKTDGISFESRRGLPS
jgi:hypothetical protein